MTKREYFYLCCCGCGTKSETLNKDEYVRLGEGEKWLSKDCQLENASVIMEFKGGNLVKQSDY